MIDTLRRIKNRFFPKKEVRERQLLKEKWNLEDGDRTLRLNYDLDENSVVLDLGGYKGQWASDIYDKYFCNIFVFEPVTTFSEKISERFSQNDKIKVFACGLGGSTKTETIYISADASSIYSGGENAQTIEIVDVKDWLEQNGITHIDLMKINIEGGEYELLERMIECNLVGIVDDIQVQFHKVKMAEDPRSRMEKIQKELMKTHELTYQYTFIWENWRRKQESV